MGISLFIDREAVDENSRPCNRPAAGAPSLPVSDAPPWRPPLFSKAPIARCVGTQNLREKQCIEVDDGPGDPTSSERCRRLQRQNEYAGSAPAERGLPAVARPATFRSVLDVVCRGSRRNELARGFCSSLRCVLANPDAGQSDEANLLLASRYGATHAD